MRKSIFWIAVVLMVMALASLACSIGGEEPTATPPPTATPRPPTATPVPPTPTEEPSPTPEPEPAAPVGEMIEAESETHGVRLSYPEGWFYDDTFFVMLSSDPDLDLLGGEDMPEGVIMIIMSGPSEEMEMEGGDSGDMFGDLIEEFGGGGEDAEILGMPVEKTINGIPVQIIEFRATEEGENIRGKIAVYDDGEQAGVVIAVSPDDLWDDYADTVDVILESIELFEGTGFEFDITPPGGDGEWRDHLVYGDLVNDEFTGDDLHDWTFDGSAGEYVTVILTPLDDEMDVTIRLLDPDGTVLIDLDDAFSGETEVLLDYELPADGEYTIQVEEFYGQAGDYDLELQGGPDPMGAIAPADADEMGEIVLDEEFAVTLAEGELHAWYLYSAGVGDMVDIVLTPSEDLDVTLSVIAPDGTMPVDQLDKAFSGEAEEVHCLVLDEPGDYIILVDDFWDAAGDYSLLVSPCEESGGGGGEILIGELVWGTLAEGEDHEWTVTADAGDEVDIFLTPKSEGMDMALSVLAPDGTVLIAGLDDAFSDEPEEVYGLALPQAGDYTVIVEEFWDEPGDYTLIVNYAGESGYEIIEMGDIAYGEVGEGKLIEGQYVHVWYLEGVAGDVVTIIVEPLTSDADLQLGFMDPDGELLFDLDEWSEGVSEEIVSYELLATGAYTVLIAEYWDSYAEYELSVELD